MSKSFFDEVVDLVKYEKINIYLIGVPLGLVLLWIYNAIPDQRVNALVYMVMLIVWGIGATADLLWEAFGKRNNMSANGLGKAPLKPFLIGLALTLFIFFLTPQSIVKPFSLVDSSVLGFLFVVIAAPIVEANAFRGLIQPMLTNVFEEWFFRNKSLAWGLALVIQCGAFAFFHVNVISGGAIDAYVPYFVFGVIATVVVYGTKSIAGEWGLHGANNFIAYVVR